MPADRHVSETRDKTVLETEPLGLERGTVRLSPYDPRWPTLFEDVSSQLHAQLEGRILSIEHVGSTSVPGLSAKPILDILIVVADFNEARDLIHVLEELSFEYRPDEEIPDRHYFRRLDGSRRTHHLSLAELNSRFYRRTIGFRDALRGDPDVRAAYESLKRDLAARHSRSREEYLEGKTDFVLNVLAQRGLLD